MIHNRPQKAEIFPVLIHCAVVFLGLAAAITASAMEIDPRVTGHIIYSDNISLDPPGDETSTFVGMLEPGINIIHESSRVALDVDYMFQFIWYQDIDGANQAYHFGSVGLDLALIKDKFFLETLFDRSQTQIDPTQPLSSTNIPFIINRTDRTLLQTAPHWRSPFLGQNLDIRYTVGKFKYDDPLTQDSTFQLAQSSFASTESDSGLGWRLNHQYVIFEYDTPPDTKAQSLILNLNYGFGNGFSLIGSAGLESEFGNYTSSTLEDPVWPIPIYY